jgi:DNA-binding LacI/PurR family transcriptional regulator
MLDELSINRKAGPPVYKQVERRLLEWIQRGELQPGDRLPSVRALSERIGITPVTVRHAIRGLVDRGIVVSRQGQGTFVSEQRTRNLDVALVVPDLSIPLCAGISRGVSRITMEHQCHVTVLDSHDDPEIEARNLRRMDSEEYRGVIIFSLMGPRPVREFVRLILAGFPVVLVDRYLVDFPSFVARPDDRRGGYLATEHLIQAGCRHIAFVSDLLDTTTRGRFQGYCEALGDNGIPFRRELVSEVLPPEDMTVENVRGLLEMTPRPDGIFFGNDIRALQGMQVIKAAGLRIPEDIALVGFDDTPMAALADPPLTTVRQDAIAIGEAAAELLWRQLSHPAGQAVEPETRVIPVDLVARASTARSGAAVQKSL